MGKYEEALERARAGKPIDEVFPELKDEGIRNELYGFISSIQHSYLCANDRREKWLAWLERQKKQKPVHTAKEMWKEMRLEVYAQASGNRHEPNHSDDSTKMFSLRDIDEIFEKIGNSIVGLQPAKMDFPCGENETVDKLIAIAECLEMDGDCSFNGYTGAECGKFLRDLAGKQVECKPAEWSKEDEKMLTSIIERGSSQVPFGEPALLEKQMEWLMNVLKFHRLKPNLNWSEEDKKFIKHCAELLDGRGEPMCAIRLKSLLCRSLWKPSERQLEAFRTSIAYWRGTTNETPSVRVLESLYCNLKDYFKI